MRGVARRAAAVFGLVAALALAATPCVAAKNRKAGLSEDLSVFVLGNTLFTLYHELGHALIDKLQIPVLGREEDAVDALAVLMMLPEKEDPAAEEMILVAADGHMMAYEQSEEDAEAFWDEHSMDMQRYAAITCLLFGSDPEGWAELADTVEMPDDQRERCPATFAQTAASWDRLLKPHYRTKGDRRGGKARLRFKPPAPQIDPRLVELLKKSPQIKAAVATVSESFVLPRDFEVVFESCDDVNAYYYPETGNVSMCYELAGYFAELFSTLPAEEEE